MTRRSECECFLDGTQIFSRDILDQRHLQRGAIVELADHDRNRFETRRARRAEPPLARDQLEMRSVAFGGADSPHDQRLDNSLALNRAFEFFEFVFVKMEPRLKRPGLYLIDGNVRQMRPRAGARNT